MATCTMPLQPTVAWNIPPQQFVSWLLIYHDMGLIGVLQPLYGRFLHHDAAGFPPTSYRWLSAIAIGEPRVAPTSLRTVRSEKLTPNSAQLDLSSWDVLNGAEPIRQHSLSILPLPCRVRVSSRGFYPCYGMAEQL